MCARAEEAGFSGIMAADHFQPWTPQQGQASFVWEVLAVAGARTKGDLGPGVTCPSFRMHPAIVAQAAATLEVMYPGRTWLGLGSGEALNEHVVAGYWPEAPERINRMFEAIEIISKALHRQGRQARRPLLQDGDVAPVDDARGPAADLHRHGRAGHRQADGRSWPTA